MFRGSIKLVVGAQLVILVLVFLFTGDWTRSLRRAPQGIESVQSLMDFDRDGVPMIGISYRTLNPYRYQQGMTQKRDAYFDHFVNNKACYFSSYGIPYVIFIYEDREAIDPWLKFVQKVSVIEDSVHRFNAKSYFYLDADILMIEPPGRRGAHHPTKWLDDDHLLTMQDHSKVLNAGALLFNGARVLRRPLRQFIATWRNVTLGKLPPFRTRWRHTDNGALWEMLTRWTPCGLREPSHCHSHEDGALFDSCYSAAIDERMGANFSGAPRSIEPGVLYARDAKNAFNRHLRDEQPEADQKLWHPLDFYDSVESIGRHTKDYSASVENSCDPIFTPQMIDTPGVWILPAGSRTPILVPHKG